MELSLDTSTATAGVAVSNEGRVLAEIAWRAGYSHTLQLYPAIEQALKLAGTTVGEITHVVVACGPGTFSGLRVGVSAAKGFALARALPLAAVSTMAVEAYPFMGCGLPIRPILDGGRGELAVGTLRESPEGLIECAPVAVLTLAALIESTREPTLFCGERLPEVAAELGRLGVLAVIPPFSAAIRRPGSLAALGWRRIQAGLLEDLAALQPVYLRAPTITPPKPRGAVKPGKEQSA